MLRREQPNGFVLSRITSTLHEQTCEPNQRIVCPGGKDPFLWPLTAPVSFSSPNHQSAPTSAQQTKISHRRSTYGVCACMLLNTIFGRRPSLGVQKPGFRLLLISFVTWADSSRISGPRFLCKRRWYYVPCLLLGNAAGKGLESVCVGVVLTFDKAFSE